MLFENVHVGRIVVHEIFQREADRACKTPAFAESLESLSAEAIGAFRLRLTEALSGQSQSLEMRIAKYGSGSFIKLSEGLIGSNDHDFLKTSKAVAAMLADVQTARRIPGGMVIVFDGTVGAPEVPFIGVIKAETQAGFRRSNGDAGAVVEFLQNIFLTPATRLYKIGLMVRNSISDLPTGWKAFVFDSNISVSNREAAAAYFYDSFLGCALPSDGAYETARFFDLTKEFIKKSGLDPESKRNIIDSLYVFVRDDKDVTFTADQFCDRYLPSELRDPYSEFIQVRKFTPAAVIRDTSQMGTRLRRRRLKFGSDIELSASPEALAHKVQIDGIAGETVDGHTPLWTRILVREALTGEQ